MLQITNIVNQHLSGVTWWRQILLFCTVFWLITIVCSVPEGQGFESITLDQVLEDFGVFLMFLGIWCGLYAHFQRDISIGALLLLFGAALIQEELNLFNYAYQLVNLVFGREIGSDERQRGDVILLAAVAVTLLLRVANPKFRSLFRIHVTLFLWFYTCFLLWVHYLFPYELQQELLSQRLEYQNEFISTYPGRFDYLCQTGPLICFSWVGDVAPEELAQDEGIQDQIMRHADIDMNASSFIGVVPIDEGTVFRGVDAQQKYLVTYYKNHTLNRVVIDDLFPVRAAAVVTRPLLIFSTAFGMVWFFGGLLVVMMHQSRPRKVINQKFTDIPDSGAWAPQ
jgi:hypothetical protein|tara:strand:+ start:39719 stop:40735 length:1017 start_codon:yes stop_codon:yes gene_type:complete